jgi:hypothetical protein
MTGEKLHRALSASIRTRSAEGASFVSVVGFDYGASAIGRYNDSGRSTILRIKSWITSWDIETPPRPHAAAETIATDYSESSEIEQAPADDGEDDRAG